MSVHGYNLSLSHYSGHGEPIVPHSVEQKPFPEHRGDKPAGFWVSVDGDQDWKEWCESEDWGVDRLKHHYRVTLAPNANILVIDSAHALLDFARKFAVRGDYSYYCDWVKVAQQWQGVIIAPYLWACRLGEPSWYYGWDCASGCIWDAKAIESVELIEVRDDAIATG